MYTYIKGKLTELYPNSATIEAHGIGYQVLIPLTTYTHLTDKLDTQIHLHLAYVVREDAHTLYGFLTPQDREHFNKVRDVSGIGPKTALSLIGHMDAEALEWAIAKQDANAISKVPGIGKKTAQRLIVDLQGKFATTTKPTQAASCSHDAVSALIQLGYSLDKAQKAVSKALEKTADKPNLSDLIALALQHV